VKNEIGGFTHEGKIHILLQTGRVLRCCDKFLGY